MAEGRKEELCVEFLEPYYYIKVKMQNINFYDQERGRTNEMLRWGQVVSHVEDKREKLGICTLRLRMDEEGTSQFLLSNGTSYQIINLFFFF